MVFLGQELESIALDVGGFHLIALGWLGLCAYSCCISLRRIDWHSAD